MENFAGLIFFIIFAIIGIASKNAKKNANQQQATQTNSKSSSPKGVMQQITDLIEGVKTETISSENTRTTNSQSHQPHINSKPKAYTSTMHTIESNQRVYKSTLEGFNDEGHKVEGYQMEGHKVEGYQMEGQKVEGYQVEGYQVEGLKRKHSNSVDYNSHKNARTESSMGKGYMGEGCSDHYGLSYLESSEIPKKTALKKITAFSDNLIVQGIIMAEILERPRRR